MLKSLYVENYALIDELELQFGESLNIITGETGAGKSILLGAMGLLLGERADHSAIRDKNRNCIVEASFEIGAYDLEPFFEQEELDYEANTIVRRVITSGGKSRAYINDLPVRLETLRQFGSQLIDIHSQHQSLMIAQDGFRIEILDTVARQKATVQSYLSVYNRLHSLRRKLEQMVQEAKESREQEEWIRFQVEELEAAHLKVDELEELEGQLSELEHAEEIRETLTFGTQGLGEDESGVVAILSQLEKGLDHISNYYPSAEDLAERVKSSRVELQDIERELWSESERIESDPTQLQRTQNRLDTIYSLLQKHKAEDTEELIALLGDYEKRLLQIMDSDEELSKLRGEIEAAKSEALKLATKISEGRKKAAKKLRSYVEELMEGLGMPGSQFVVAFEKAKELRPSGLDNIEFRFSANKNIAPAPVEKIASGGEISRLMLSIKSLVAKSGKLPTIIFDEIDTGVSGRIANAMGDIITELSQTMQVINITHLPQVASKGENHYYVYKCDESDTSITKIRKLSDEERVEEIAKMLSGSDLTKAAIEQAKVLLSGNSK